MANTVDVTFRIDQDNQGRTVLKQIDAGIDKIGKSAKETGQSLDGSLSFLKSAVIAEFFRRGATEAIAFGKAAVEAFNQSQAAALGLQSVATFKGIAGTDAVAAVNDLELVKSGLLGVADASTALKNLLASGFSLPQAIELIKRFGDSAAFGRQSALSFGEAIRSATEGIKNGNSILVDNAGVTKNLSVILKEAGFELQDLSDKTKGAAAIQALYSGLIKETQAQVGDAAKLTNTFAGQTAQLEAQQQKLLVTLGEIITKNPDLRDGFADIGLGLQSIIAQLKDSDSALREFVDNTVSGVGTLISIVGKFLTTLNTLASVINVLKPLLSVPLSLLDAIGAVGPERGLAAVKATEAKLGEGFTKQAISRSQAEAAAEDKKFADMAKASESYFAKQATANKQFADSQIKQASDSVNRFKDLLNQASSINTLQTQKAQLEGLNDPARNLLIQRESVDRQLAFARQFLNRADSAQQRQLVNDLIIGATNDLSKLTPEQIEQRAKAIDANLKIQQDLFKEQFDKLKVQTEAQEKNTLALVAVGNRLALVERSLGNFAEKPITIAVEDVSGVVADVDAPGFQR